MSAAQVVLPLVWAYAAPVSVLERKGPMRVAEAGTGLRALASAKVSVAAPVLSPEPDPIGNHVFPKEFAFYRKYTEGLLRRYVSMSMEAGRTPSLLGRELFRGKVTNYNVQSFEDVVIFVHDVGQCVAKLDSGQQFLIRRIALQEYTQHETAEMTGLAVRTVVSRYREALDRLTRLFLERQLMEPTVYMLPHLGELPEQDELQQLDGIPQLELPNPGETEISCQGGETVENRVSVSI